MRNILGIILGSVATRNTIPVLQHLAITGGAVHAFNGRTSISTPAPALKAYSLTLPAEQFLRAIEACGDTAPSIEQHDGKFFVKAKSFRAVLPCGDITAFPLLPADDPAARKPLRGEVLIAVLRALRPFVGEDASRPWVSSVKFSAGQALVTNNVVLCAATLPKSLKVEMELPVFCVDELLRLAPLGYEPCAYCVTDSVATFYYESGTWLRCVLFSEGWPPNAAAALDTAHKRAKLRILPRGLLEAATHCSHFCPDLELPVLCLKGDSVRTLQGTTEAEAAGLKGGEDLGDGKYRAEPLLAVLAVAVKADWQRFPRVPWTSDPHAEVPLKGVLLGFIG